MSLLASSAFAPHQFSNVYPSEDIPDSMISKSVSKPVISSCKITEFLSNNGQQNAGGTSQIVIPSMPFSAIESGSSYLQVLVSITHGPQADNAAVGYFTYKNPDKTVYSLVEDFVLVGAMGAIETENKVYLLESLKNVHFSNSSFNSSDAVNLLGKGLNILASKRNIDPANGVNTKSLITVNIPLSLALFNGVCDFPLWACKNGVSLNIKWRALANCFNNSAVDLAPTAITFDNVKLITKVMTYESSFIDSIRSKGEFVMPSIFFSTLSTANNNLNTFQAQSQYQSLLGCFYTYELTTSLCSANAQTSGELFVDGQLINVGSQQTLANLPTCLYELQRAVGSLYDDNSTSSCVIARDDVNGYSGSYASEVFLCGIDLKRCKQPYSHSGTSIGSLLLKTACTAVAGSQLVMFLPHTAVIAFNPVDGSVARYE